MKISVTNIGPVKKADIDLAPLTVFIGPNNSGKSVIATVLYAALSPAGMGNLHWVEDYPRITGRFRLPADISPQVTEFILASAPGKPITYDDTPGRIRDFLSEFLNEALNAWLTTAIDEVARATGNPLERLRRMTGKRATAANITITSERPHWQASVNIRAAGNEIDLDRPPSLREIWDPMPAANFSDDPLPPIKLLLYLLFGCLQDAPPRTRYLPASRSGILNLQREIAGSIIRRSALAGIKDQRGSGMTGIVADFLAEMVELNPDSRGEFASEADRLEREVLDGQISLRGEPNPEIIYRTRTGDYPLVHTSSMVSELAPVALYLRHLLQRGDLLLIEEPEAHLHPGAQVAFAKSLVRLVNQGLKVCLTTHSEFFLQQINNAIMAGSLTNEDATALGVSDDRIDARNVAAYFFQPSDSGTTVERLPIEPKQGIPEASFDTVTDQLYDQIIALDRRIGGQDE